MSNEYKDWIEDQKNAPINSVDHNRWLCYRYPWLIPHSRWTDEEIKDYDFSYTELDAMPDGWRKAFGEQMCEEIQKLLEEADWVDKYRILQIKEKFGSLRWYDSAVPDSIKERLDAIIKKYEDLSERTCFICGAPATKISTGWICPWCDECASECEYDVFVPIDEWFKKIEDMQPGELRIISIEPV